MIEPQEVSNLVSNRFIKLVGCKFEIVRRGTANSILKLSIQYYCGACQVAVNSIDRAGRVESDDFGRQAEPGDQLAIGVKNYRALNAGLTGSHDIVELLGRG